MKQSSALAIKSYARYVLLLVLALGLAFSFIESTISAYIFVTQVSLGGGWAWEAGVAELIIGFCNGYLFFLALLLEAFGDIDRYTWLISSVALPSLVLLIDFPHIYFPVLLVGVGYFVGSVLRKLLPASNE